MANPEDPVTHAELSELLDEKLGQLRDLLPKIPGAEPVVEDDDGDDDGPRFSLRDMEAYAERQVKKAVKDLAGKSPKKPAPKPVVEDDDEPVTKTEPVTKVEPVVEPTPDPSPGKKTKQEKFWGKA